MFGIIAETASSAPSRNDSVLCSAHDAASSDDSCEPTATTTARRRAIPMPELTLWWLLYETAAPARTRSSP